jgi:hypothetical protein
MHRLVVVFLSSLLALCLTTSHATNILSTRRLQQATVISSACIQDFQEIYDIESTISDTSVNRTYIICPNKLYDVGYLDSTFQNLRPKQSGGPPLPLRSNTKIQCGDNGSRENLCYITGGDLQVDGTSIRGMTDEAMENVQIQGFVFINANKYSFWATKRGSVTFRDCEWRVRVIDDVVSCVLYSMLSCYDDVANDCLL